MVGIILITKQYTVIPCATSPPPVLNKEVVKEHLSIFYFLRDQASLQATLPTTLGWFIYSFLSLINNKFISYSSVF